MAILHVTVPTTEHPDGAVEYPSATAQVNENTHTLEVMRGGLIVAEFPEARYLSWELLSVETEEQASSADDVPAPVEG
jgi:hypothetical protein